MYSREIVAEVLAASDIVDIVGRSLELKRAGGARFKGLCPFHNEKTPSFHVDQNRQMFHCFGCGKGGDTIAFIMEHEGLSFVESLQQLADRAAIRLPAPQGASPDEQDLRADVLKFNRSACLFFQRNLAHPETGRIGREYLETRHLKPETIARFELGYAPDGYSHLLDAARKKGADNKIMEASGLFKRKDGGSLYDTFRNRLIIPVKDVSGRTVAFGGRDLGDSPAKYINSPETLVYRKSRVLYALDEARDAMRKAGYALLMEGYFDVLRCFDAGIDHAVATCGTALTLEQAQLLKRYVPEVVLVYDGDSAGIQAALKGVAILVQAGLRVRVASLPDGQDPDDFVRDKGPEAFLEAIGAAPGFVPFYAAASAARLTTVEGKTAVANELFAIIKVMGDPILTEEYLKLVAEALDIHPWECKRAYNAYLQHRVEPARPTEPPKETVAEFTASDGQILAAFLRCSDQWSALQARLAELKMPDGPLGEILEAFLRDGIRADYSVHGFSEAAGRLWTHANMLTEEEVKDPAVTVEKWIARYEVAEIVRASHTKLTALKQSEMGLEEQKELLKQLRDQNRRRGAPK